MRSADPILTVEGLYRDVEKLEFSPYSVFGAFYKSSFEHRSFGDSSGGETPGPIPNPAVKPASADGTWGAAPRESRSLPRDLCYYRGLHTSLNVGSVERDKKRRGTGIQPVPRLFSSHTPTSACSKV